MGGLSVQSQLLRWQHRPTRPARTADGKGDAPSSHTEPVRDGELHSQLSPWKRGRAVCIQVKRSTAAVLRCSIKDDLF